jgi:SulP family sulfate permease
MIPLAALVGVMFMVVIGTFEWASFKIIRGVNKEDAFVLFLVTFVTVIADLAIAVVVGVIVSALVFAWKHATHIAAKTYTDKDDWKVYELEGPLFFGSVSHFKEIFDPQNDPSDVVIDFNESRIWDSSGIDALDTLADKYEAAGKKLHIRHISPECRKLLRKASKYVEINVNEDPRYYVATDELG